MFNLAVRLQARLTLREVGYGFFEINRLMAKCDDAVIADAVAASGAAIPTEMVGALGDGAILKKIIEFLQSDTGKMLIQILLSLLLAI